MKKDRLVRRVARHTRAAHRRVVVTIGELVAAAYEAAPGLGKDRAEAAKRILTRSPLARAMNPHLQFV